MDYHRLATFAWLPPNLTIVKQPRREPALSLKRIRQVRFARLEWDERFGDLVRDPVRCPCFGQISSHEPVHFTWAARR